MVRVNDEVAAGASGIRLPDRYHDLAAERGRRLVAEPGRHHAHSAVRNG